MVARPDFRINLEHPILILLELDLRMVLSNKWVVFIIYNDLIRFNANFHIQYNLIGIIDILTFLFILILIFLLIFLITITTIIISKYISEFLAIKGKIFRSLIIQFEHILVWITFRLIIFYRVYSNLYKLIFIFKFAVRKEFESEYHFFMRLEMFRYVFLGNKIGVGIRVFGDYHYFLSNLIVFCVYIGFLVLILELLLNVVDVIVVETENVFIFINNNIA